MRFFALLVVAAAGCTVDHEFVDLAGGDGELRFNLEFTNETSVDLDLHVFTPNGEEIYYGEKEDSTGGQLDVDCYCAECPQGPAENVFWPYESQPAPGTYSISVEYFAACDFWSGGSSDYTLRVLEGGVVIDTYTGRLNNEYEWFDINYTVQ